MKPTKLKRVEALERRRNDLASHNESANKWSAKQANARNATEAEAANMAYLWALARRDRALADIHNLEAKLRS